jgi:MFS transporter, MCT family, solute carrier family 16 (monocarboxylic acid transporters), member 10
MYGLTLMVSPAYASSLNLNKTESALVLSLLNAGSVVGRLGLGFLSDKLDPWVLAVGTLVSTMLSVFVLWGESLSCETGFRCFKYSMFDNTGVCSFNLAGLLVFGLAYGVFAGGWGTLWTGFIRGNIRDRARTTERGEYRLNRSFHTFILICFSCAASGPDDPQLVSTLFGYLMLSRGIGSIFSTPISSVLQPSSSGQGSVSLSKGAINNATSLAFRIAPVKDTSVTSSLHASTGFSVANHRFQNLIIYVGTCFAAASVVMLIGWSWEKWSLNFQRSARTGRAENAAR